MGRRCIMWSRRRKRNEAMAMALQNAQVIVCWQKKLILGVALFRAAPRLRLLVAFVDELDGSSQWTSVFCYLTISPPHSLLCFCFFSQYSHTRQCAYAKYPYTVARRDSSSFFLFPFSFCALSSNKSFPPLFSFPVSTIHLSFLSLSLFSLSLLCWPLADPESHYPIPFLYHHHGRSLRSSVY